MSIRFASAASAVALAACFATPAFASDADGAILGPVEASEIVLTDDEAATLLPAIKPIDLAITTGQEDDTPAITISGAATLTSDYRFRGVSQTDEGMAVQGGITVSHESGLYVGAWASNLAGWGTFGGSNTELDLIAGFKLPVGEGTLDTGLVWYMYPTAQTPPILPNSTPAFRAPSDLSG
jgi:uncharacterized protein (TIGR02001 family)